jgi:hypothetical protein
MMLEFVAAIRVFAISTILSVVTATLDGHRCMAWPRSTASPT